MVGLRPFRRVVAGILLAVLAAPAAGQVPVWIEQGPNGIRNNANQQNITPNSTVSGAVQTIALHPTLGDTALIGTVNGGIWRTTDAGVNWTPVTNSNTQFTSQGIGSIAYDVTNSNVLVAGFGRYSSFGGTGGAQAGLIRSTDGGVTWTAINGSGAVSMRQHQVQGVYAAGTTIVASTSFSDTNNAYGNIGLIRSTDGGATYSIISGNAPGTAPNGLPGGFTLGMAGRRVGGNDILLTATQFATTNGIYRSANGGATWSLVTSTGLTSLFAGGNVINAKFAFGPNNTAYAVLVNGSGVVAGIYRSTDNGATWANNSLDFTIGVETLNPGGQGDTHFSVAAHPTDQNIVYVGGDRTPASPFASQTFRINAGLAAGSQASRFTNADTANNSNPHADTRSMAFDAAGRIWQGNDGGIYRRDNVTAGAGSWVSLNPGLRTTEVTGVAYDRITKALITGHQDNGTAVMAPGVTVNTALASKVWTNILSGDGGKVASDPLNVGLSTVATNTTRYYSAQFLQARSRAQYDATNAQVGGVATPTMTVINSGNSIFTHENNAYPNFNGQNTGTLQFLQPLVVNQVQGGRLYLGTRRIYESINQGTTLQDLNGDLAASAGFAGGTGAHGLEVRAMKAGGRSGVTLQPNVLYVGTASVGSTNIGGEVFVRPAGAAAQTAVVRLTAYNTAAGDTFNNSAVNDLAMDPLNWQSVYVATPKRVWFGDVAVNGASSTWTDFTGNLTPGGTVFTETTGTFSAVVLVPVAADPGRRAVIVGTSGGLFFRYTDAGANTWASFLGADMPNAFFTELHYDMADDILIASSLGRGVWTFPNASTFFAPVPEPAGVTLIGMLAAGGVVGLRRLRQARRAA